MWRAAVKGSGLPWRHIATYSHQRQDHLQASGSQLPPPWHQDYSPNQCFPLVWNQPLFLVGALEHPLTKKDIIKWLAEIQLGRVCCMKTYKQLPLQLKKYHFFYRKNLILFCFMGTCHPDQPQSPWHFVVAPRWTPNGWDHETYWRSWIIFHKSWKLRNKRKKYIRY